MRSVLALGLALAFLLAGCIGDNAASPSGGQKVRAAGGHGTAGGAASEATVDVPLPKNAWKALKDGPIPRAEHCVANQGEFFYVIGGLIVPNSVSLPGPAGSVPAAVPTPRVDVYNAKTDTWSTGPDFPSNTDHCLAIGYGGYIYQFSGSAQKIKVGGTAWQPVAAPPHGHGASGVVGVWGDKIVVVGGGGGQAGIPDIYDPASNTWTSLPNAMPTGRNHMAGAIVGNKLYAIGGDLNGGCGHGCNSDANEILDLVTGEWTNGTNLPVKRGSLHAFEWYGHVIVMGGQNGQTNVPAFADVDAYDPVTNAWTKLAPMSHPRHGFGGGEYENKIYVFAGAPQQGVSSFAGTDAMEPQ